jgi:hypothetical protein
MIKAVGATGQGQPLLLLGLSGENVARLAAGEPISISPAAMRKLGLPAMQIVVIYGRTEGEILAALKAGRSGGASVSPR